MVSLYPSKPLGKRGIISDVKLVLHAVLISHNYNYSIAALIFMVNLVYGFYLSNENLPGVLKTGPLKTCFFESACECFLSFKNYLQSCQHERQKGCIVFPFSYLLHHSKPSRGHKTHDSVSFLDDHSRFLFKNSGRNVEQAKIALKTEDTTIREPKTIQITRIFLQIATH